MNVKSVEFELAEALLNLQELVGEVRAGRIHEDDAPALAVELGHILDHLCIAWNARNLTTEQWASLSQDEFERLMKTVPNFYGGRIMGDFACA